MSANDNSIIDFIGVDKETNKVILSVSDHLDWNEELPHLYQLQEKVNACIAFIEQGEIYSVYPQAVNKLIVIDIVFKFEPPSRAVELLAKIKVALNDLNVNLTYRLL